MYDAIIVGARCAGSPTAMLLARKGYRVLLVDKATFPSETISANYIHQPGVAKLKSWGLLDRVIASNCPPITRYKMDFGSFAIDSPAPTTDGVAEAYCPRRIVLDKILVDAAVEAGAELREGFVVDEFTKSNGRVTGIKGHAKGGVSVTEQARIVVGADGRRSTLAPAVQAPMYNIRPSYTCAYISYWSDVPVEGMEFYPRDGKAVLAVPTNDGLTGIGVGWRSKQFEETRLDYEGNYHRTIESIPALAKRVREGCRMGRIVGVPPLTNFFRRPYGLGWALVGDAGYQKDPMAGQGITDAFRDAELLAQAIDDGFNNRKPLNKSLARYEQQRNEAAMPMYELTCRLAMLEPPSPGTAKLYSAFGGNQPS